MKLTRVDGKVTVTKLMSDMTKYNGIRLVSNEKRVYYYDAKGLLWYLDLQDETTHQKIDQPQDIDMNVNCGWFASESEPSKRVYKCGLKKPDGTVVLDQVYDSIYYVTSGYYAIGTREGDELFYRLANSNGEILISKKYLSIGYNEALDWILLTGYWPIKDRNNPGTTFNFNAVTSYYDLKSGKLIAEAVELNLEMLATVGYSLAQAYTGEGYSRMVNSYDEFGHFLSRDMEYVGDTLQGVFSREGVYLLEPKYIMLNPLFDQYEATMKFEGYFQFDLVESTHTCGSRYFDGNTKKMAEETYTCQIIRKGIFSVKDGIVLEPKYTNILFSGQDIIQAEYTNFVRNEATQYVEELGRNESFYYAGPSPMPKYGLISVTQRELIPALYEGFSSTNESSPNPTASIEFNKYGFMKIYKSNWDGVHDETFFNLVGLINRNGIVIEPIYKVLYIRNGYIYMQDKEGSWTIKNASDLTQTITIDKSLAESINYDSVQIVGDYIVVERKVVDDLERYSLYGIYNKDLSVFLPIEYTSVTFDGTYWYLEKYDDVNGVYPRAIMDTDKHYIVAFSSQYDYLSEFVGGYAVGQSGTYTATTSSAVPSKKYAAKKDAPFVLNLINVDGIVVSDLSDQYESITLLGQTDSVSRALVKKNGIYYFANLVEGPRIIKVPSKFNVSAWMIGGISMVGLGLGLYWMTKKKGLRLFHKKA